MLNRELVRERFSWWYRNHAPGDMVLEGLENDVREGQKGLWADPQTVPPWGVEKTEPVSDAWRSDSVFAQDAAAPFSMSADEGI